MVRVGQDLEQASILPRAAAILRRTSPPAGDAAWIFRPGSRLLTPIGPTDDGPATLVEAGPLYAGETVARIGDVRPAAELVAELTP